MGRRLTIAFISIMLVLAASYMAVSRKSDNKSRFDLVVDKLLKQNAKATTQDIEVGQIVNHPDKAVAVSIGSEKVYVYEFKDETTTKNSFPLITEGAPGEDFIADYKGNVAIKYSGHDEKIIQQFKALFD